MISEPVAPDVSDPDETIRGRGAAADAPSSVYVWAWLPGRVEPVVAGRLERDGERYRFGYGRSYLERSDAVALHAPELPLGPGAREPLPGLVMPGCLRDALPDAWGRRVVLARLFGARAVDAVSTDPDELVFALESASDRVGALDFQGAADRYRPRGSDGATLEALLEASDRIEAGRTLPAALEAAILHGTSIGGARPKAFLGDDERRWIAKFASSDDDRPVVRHEYVAMRLAADVGLDVAPVRLERVLGRDVLLVERFDRVRVDGGWARRAVVSALTLFELDEMMARYASYEELASLVCRRFSSPRATLVELFSRMTFNVLVGNTDDHARNHAAFAGEAPSLTPAYDVCPQRRTGGEAAQAMRVHGAASFSRLSLCLAAAPSFRLSRDEAAGIARRQVDVIRDRYEAVCDGAGLSDAERRALRGGPVLNPYAFEGLGDALDGRT